MQTLALQNDHITLAQAIKASGLASSGGQAKHLVRNGQVLLNGKVEIQPGHQLKTGDRFQVTGQAEWTVTR